MDNPGKYNIFILNIKSLLFIGAIALSLFFFTKKTPPEPVEQQDLTTITQSIKDIESALSKSIKDLDMKIEELKNKKIQILILQGQQLR